MKKVKILGVKLPLARRIQQDIDFLCPAYAESINRQAADTTQYMVYIMIKVYFNLYFV